MDCNIIAFPTYLPKETADIRELYFSKKIHPVYTAWLEAQNPGAGIEEIKSYRVSFKMFESLIDTVYGTTDHSGLRVYFANLIGTEHALRKSQLTLIFTPTVKDGLGYHQDNDAYYHLHSTNPDIVRLEPEIAKEWVLEFKDKKRVSRVLNSGNADTQCIWHNHHDVYAWYRLTKCAPKIPQLASVDEVEFVFGGYEPGNYEDQINFFLRLYAKNKPITFPLIVREDFERESFDTGNPCPPPRDGCNGAKLFI